MADTQSKIDVAAEKAFAEAADRKTAEGGKAATRVPTEAAGKADAQATRPAAAPRPVAAGKATAATKAKPAPVKAVRKSKSVAKNTKAARKPSVKRAASPAPAKAAKPHNSNQPPLKQLKEKIMATAKTTDFSKSFTDAAADMQGRVKAAYEKGAEMTAELTAFHKGNFEAVVESGKVLSTGMQDMGRSAIEDLKGAAETATDDVKKMAAVKSPTELFQLQGEIARRNFDAAIAQSSKATEAMMKLANDVFAPLTSRASLAAEKLTKAA